MSGAEPGPIRWTAVVPVKPPASGKTRLSGMLAPQQRAQLVRILLDHVLRELRLTAGIADIVLLCEAPPAGWTGRWIADRGRGLNAELEQAACGLAGGLLTIHADLPMLDAADVAALLASAAGGAAIAPDRHGTGTNALAIAGSGMARFAFGTGSFAAHRLAIPDAVVVDRPGLAFDLDTPADWAALIAPDLLARPMREVLAAVCETATDARRPSPPSPPPAWRECSTIPRRRRP